MSLFQLGGQPSRQFQSDSVNLERKQYTRFHHHNYLTILSTAQARMAIKFCKITLKIAQTRRKFLTQAQPTTNTLQSTTRSTQPKIQPHTQQATNISQKISAYTTNWATKFSGTILGTACTWVCRHQIAVRRVYTVDYRKKV